MGSAGRPYQHRDSAFGSIIPRLSIQEKARQLKVDNVRSQAVSGRAQSRLRDSDERHPASKYQPGVIFSAPHHTAGDDEKTSWVETSDVHRVATPFGCVHSKYRKFVVVATSSSHCTCLPIYTREGKGLAQLRFPNEWMGIRDCSDESTALAEVVNGIIRCTNNADYSGPMMRSSSCIHLTEITSHRLDSFATIEGYLPKTDLARLLALFQKVNFGGFSQLTRQKETDSDKETEDELEDGELEEGEIMED